jgi:hypothetical protein
MKTLKAMTCAIACAISATTATASDWYYSQTVDRFTDEVRTIYKKESMTIRCNDTRFDIIVDFDEYLSNESVRVTYRFDKKPAVDTKWSISTEGTSTFVINWDRADFLRELINAETLIIKAFDYKGTPHVTEVDLGGGSMEKFSSVADQCGVAMQISESLTQAKALVSKSDRDVVELMGPKATRCQKDTLSKLGHLDASDVNSEKDESLYKALAAYSADNRDVALMGSWLKLYADGSKLATDKAAYKEECGGLIV